jgi:hypothetical protein
MESILGGEGYFGNFTNLSKILNLSVKIVDRGSNYEYWVSIGPNDPM